MPSRGPSRVAVRLGPDDKATLTRATLSGRDFLRILSLLENPPAANDRLVRAAKAGFVLPLAKAAEAIGDENSGNFRA